MSYFNMVCDSCGREVQGITWVNGMKFCAKCYQEIYGNKNMTENLNNMYEAYLKILNEKDQRIAELEEQLKGYIRPKFKVGQTVYTFNKSTECVYELCIKIIRIEINEISKFNSLVYLAERLEDGNFFGYFEVELFATKEEAIAKLRELQGEKK